MIYSNDKTRIIPFEKEKHMTEKYRSWFHDPETTRYNSHGLFPYTPAAMRAFVKTIEEGDSSKIVWAIEMQYERPACPPGSIPGPPPPIVKDWKHVGNCSLQQINLINRSAELTIVIGAAKARGIGIGAAACRWMLFHSFMRLGLNRVWTGTSATNAAMQKTCLKIGMEQEGVFKEAITLNGKYVDVIAYGITREQYDNFVYKEAQRS